MPAKKRAQYRSGSSRKKETGPSAEALAKNGFSHFDLAPDLLKGIAAAGYSEPTPIQAQMIPLALDEQNVVGWSQTGTGKTAAFLIPMLALLEETEHPDTIDGPTGPPRILVVVPTRELAIQVTKECDRLTRFLPVRAACCYGGMPIDRQMRDLKTSAVVIGTPGRLLDLMGRRAMDLGDLDVLVLDEVDRMYDMGFRDDVDRILRYAESREQTLLTSATMNDDVEALLAKHVGEHARVAIETKTATVDQVDQTFYYVDPRRKQELILAVIADLKPERGIVFVRTRFNVDRLTYRLQERGVDAELIHSGLPQRKREKILLAFRQGKFPLLIATDVASRGLHIDDVTHVVNFDLPQTPEDYVHRVGRTARMGRSGAAVSFVTADDGPILTAIEKLINKQIRQETFPGFDLPPAKVKKPNEAPAAPERVPGIPRWATPKRRRR